MHETAADENLNANQAGGFDHSIESNADPQQLAKGSEMRTVNISTVHQDPCHCKKKQFQAITLK